MSQNNFSSGPAEITGLGPLPLEGVFPPQLVAYPNDPLQNQISKFTLGCFWLNTTRPAVWELVSKAKPSVAIPNPIHWVQIYPQVPVGPQLQQFTVTTNDNVPTPIISIPVPVGAMVTINATIAAHNAGTGEGLYSLDILGARNTGGGAVLVDIGADITGNDSAGGIAVTPSFGVAGNNIQLLVTGEAATVWHWTAIAIIVTQS